MILAGLQKTSLIDYPGKVSCVAFLTGCNFTCPFCHNAALAKGIYPQRISIEQFLEFLSPRRRLLDGVVVTGGEPTLNPALENMCRAIRKLDPDLKIKLDTNGSRPGVLEQLINHRLVDYVAMDIKTPLDGYPPFLVKEAIGRKLERSIRLIMDSAPDYEFRTTCVRPFVDEAKIVNIAQTIQGARRYVLQAFKPSNMLQPDFFKDHQPEIPHVEIDRFKDSAAPLVRECLIRNAS